MFDIGLFSLICLKALLVFQLNEQFRLGYSGLFGVFAELEEPQMSKQLNETTMFLSTDIKNVIWPARREAARQRPPGRSAEVLGVSRGGLIARTAAQRGAHHLPTACAQQW
jgi:hypothetical protein